MVMARPGTPNRSQLLIAIKILNLCMELQEEYGLPSVTRACRLVSRELESQCKTARPMATADGEWPISHGEAPQTPGTPPPPFPPPPPPPGRPFFAPVEASPAGVPGPPPHPIRQ